jgi:MFS family permease
MHWTLKEENRSSIAMSQITGPEDASPTTVVRGEPTGKAAGNSMVKVAFASAMGTLIEIYDFLIYATAAALVFGHLFFPALGESAGNVAAFATLGIAFLARPFGAIAFGHIGDRLGRKRTLIATMLFMGSATVLIGLLPSAATIGIAAPIILVVLRIFQGFAAGGEWAGAVLFTSEHAPPGKRGFWSMFSNLGGCIGNILALGTFFVANVTMSKDDFLSFGWRIPFLVSAVLFIFGLWIRLTLKETPVFEAEQAKHAATEAPLIEAVRRQWREILLGGGTLLMAFALNYLQASYLISYGTTALHLNAGSVLGAGVAGGVTLGIGVIAGGTWSDYLGRRKVLLIANTLGVLWSLVLFPLLDSRSIVAFWAGVTISTLISGLAFGVAGSFMSELYQTRYRYTAAAIAYSLAAIFGGAVPPLVAAPITSAFGSYAFSLFLALLCLVALICTVALAETKQRDLIDITRPVAVAGA